LPSGFATKNFFCISQLYPHMLQATLLTSGRYNITVSVNGAFVQNRMTHKFQYANGAHLWPMVTT
jgi:hypothetical protein